MRVDGLSTDPRMLSEVIAMLILRGGSDTLTFSPDEQEQLRRVFPNGFALVAYGEYDDAALSLRLLGRESEALIELIHGELQRGRTDALERLFEERKGD